MKGNTPNINHIVLADLTDNDRLVELYRQAVQRRIWCDNSERDFIEFVNRAMKALHANSQEHPALLFRWLINHPSYGDIPQMCEKITFARFNSQSRQNALALARRSSVAQAGAQLRDKPEATGSSVAYLPEWYAEHCPFPQNQLTYGQRSWTVRTPAKIIAIMPGLHLLQRQAAQEFEVPYGSIPRLIIPYLATQAVRGRRKVKTGRKLLHFLKRLGMSRGARNYRRVLHQLVNLLNCQIAVSNLAGDEDNMAGFEKIDVYGGSPFPACHLFTGTAVEDTAGCALWYKEWMEGDPRVTLSHDFYEFVRIKPIPINYRHLLKFVRSPRRMDLYAWLSHRTYRIRCRNGISIPLENLRRQFAPDLSPASYRLFRQRLREDLEAILTVHPGFKFKQTKDTLTLFNSVPPVQRCSKKQF